MEKKNNKQRRRRLDTVLRYAKKHGYQTVENRGEWGKYLVYEMILSEKEESLFIGVPQYILDDGKQLKISEVDEAFAILSYLGG